MIRAALQRGVDFVAEHNRITLLVMLVCSGVVVAGITQLQTGSQAGGTSADFDHLDTVQKSQYISEHYASGDRQSNRTVELVYVHSDGKALSKPSLLAGLRYQRAVRENQSVRRALHENGFVGISNLVATRLAGDRNASLATQVRTLDDASPSRVERAVRQVTRSPRAQRLLPTDFEAGSATASDRRLLVAFSTAPDEETRAAADQALYRQATEQSGAGFFTLGQYASQDYRNHFFGEMVELVLPVALLLILLVLAFAYRDLVDVVVGMTGVVLSVLWMFGLLGWLGVSAGMILIVPVVLITGLSIDFGFHVFNRYREQRGESDGIRAPMARGVRLVATALVLVTATSAIGFLANLANPLPVIRDLGISITLGVVSAFVIFVTVVPALKVSIDGLLERVGLDRRKQALGRGKRLKPVLERSVTLARRAAPVVLVLALVVGAAGGLAWTGLDEESYQSADGDVAEWKQQLPGPLGWETAQFPQRLDRVEEVYQPATTDRTVKSRILVDGDVTDAETLHAIDDGLAAIREQGLLLDQHGVRTVTSPVTAMQLAAQRNESFAAAFRKADSDGDGIPEENVAALYDHLYALDSDAASRVVERTDGEYRSVLVTLALDAEYENADSVVAQLQAGATEMDGPDRTVTVAGQMAVNEAVLGEIVGGIVLTMLVALLAIVVALTVVFRVMHGSGSLGAVVAVPIALVVGLVVGGMYLLGIPLTLLTALLMSLVVGMGVDYNIHVGDRFADELREGRTPLEALGAAVTGTGGALLGSTLTTAGAFATITLVPHPQLQSFGTIVVVALVTSFLVSVLVLPSLLLLWHRYVPDSVTVARQADGAVTQD